MQISWLLKKPTDLDLHCLLRQGMSCSAREGLIARASVVSCVIAFPRPPLQFFFVRGSVVM